MVREGGAIEIERTNQKAGFGEGGGSHGNRKDQSERQHLVREGGATEIERTNQKARTKG